uniref:ABC transmembrane type-1 domain-containing protein n=1 Tax=Timema bartmani TaxID=61472 RepID=A0A7R9HZ18_9NEOP|nr:unnamed protein product [Timema bartmani]
MLSSTTEDGEIEVRISDNPAIRIRVCIALSFLVGAKILNVGVPLTFKHALDHLNAHLPVSESGEAFFNLSSAPDTVLSVATALLVSFWIRDLRSELGATMGESATLKGGEEGEQAGWNTTLDVGMWGSNVFNANFHIYIFQTIDRGSRGINFVLSAMVFNVVPTMFELILVSSILGVKCGAAFAGVSLGCVTIYTAYTLAITQWRTRFRVYMNQAENEAGNKAVDSLINYETVKVTIFDNYSSHVTQLL